MIEVLHKTFRSFLFNSTKKSLVFIKSTHFFCLKAILKSLEAMKRAESICKRKSIEDTTAPCGTPIFFCLYKFFSNL